MNEFSKLAPDLHPWIWNLLVIAGSLLVGLAAKTIIHKAFSWYTKRSNFFLFQSIVKHLQHPVSVLLPLLVLNASVSVLRMDNPFLIEKILELSLLGTFAFVLIAIVKVIAEQIYHRNDVTKADNLKERKIRTQIEFISRLVTALIIVLTISAMLLSFENLRKIGTGLLAGVGVGSIIIGFAAQSSLSNLLAGFQIAFTQPIRIDDVVVLEGEWGRIEDITLTYVVVKIWDERRLVVPIRYFIEKPFQNWTRINSDLLGVVFLYMDYSLPLDKLREKFQAVLQTTPLWDKKVSVIQVTDSKERTMEIRALMSASNSSAAFDLRCFVREQLISFIQQNYPESLPRVRSERFEGESKNAMSPVISRPVVE